MCDHPPIAARLVCSTLDRMGSVLDKNSSLVRKRIENHTFEDEDGDEYEGSEFNGFGDYFRRKKIKLQNLDAEMRATSGKPQIFKGVVAYVNGYTQPPLHVLHRDIVQHGGGFLQYLDSKTMATHIIAATLPPKKAIEFSRYRIVKPAWIVDSIKAGKLLPWSDYRVLDEGSSQKVLKFDSGKGLTQTSPAAKQGYREQSDNSFYTSQLSAATPSKPFSQFVDNFPTPAQRSTCSPQSATKTETSISGAKEISMNDAINSEKPTHGSMEDLSMDDFDSVKQSTSLTSPAETSKATEPPKHMTSEEHNAWLLSDPKIRKSSTANPDFLKQFYSESRLHHLSTWKANLKSSMQRLAAEKGNSGKKIKSRPGSRRYILHVDFDSFFCAVSLKHHPEYEDKPAVVAHSTGSGSEIASCNYVARKFGVKNGMWMKRALELCPDLKVLPYDFPAYEEASRLFYESVIDVGGVVQSVSVDEALIDATAVILSATGSYGVGVDEGSVWREQENADQIALALRDTIKAKTGCAVSVGIGGNILQAKVALRKAKPAGQYQLKPEQVLDMIGDLKVEELPGVAYSIGGKLEELGIKFVKDIRDVSRERLTSALGPKTSEKLSDYARGIDRTEVGEQPPRKSVSADVNWGIRFISQQEAEDFVYNLCKELERRLVNEQVKGKHLTMKIMRRALDAPLDPTKHLGHGKCDAFNKSATFGVATHNYEVIGKEAVSILRSFKFSPGDLRGIGVQMTKLEPIKTNPAAPEGSQKKITFGPFAGPSPMKKQSRAEPIDDIESPQKPVNRQSSDLGLDPIADDPLTPRKVKVHPAMALSKASREDTRANTPLNVSGTQFILPSNPDLAVLAQLPTDIRSRLKAQRSRSVATEAEMGSPRPRSRSESPMPIDMLPSQVDVEVFNALPDDMKAEVLESYGRKPVQTGLQQSPKRPQLAQPKKETIPTKRSIHSVLGKAQRQRDAQAGVIQTSFKAPRPGNKAYVEEEVEALDPEFLAELPEDVRKEIVADHRRRRLAQQSGLDAPAPRHQADANDALPGGQRTIQFPVLPPKISFSGSVTSTQEIKDMLDAWHSETRKAGPHRRDVEVLERYLVRVIRDERDLNKAATLVKWLNVIVEQDRGEGKGRRAWRSAVKSIKDAVQRAVKERGLAPLNI